jgi:DNA-binding MarR family transcriptional regulator
MRTAMHSHSLTAHDLIAQRIPALRFAVAAALERLGEATDEQLAEHLGRPLQSITGRVGELVRDGLAVEHRTVRSEAGRCKRVCRLAAGVRLDAAQQRVWQVGQPSLFDVWK